MVGSGFVSMDQEWVLLYFEDFKMFSTSKYKCEIQSADKNCIFICDILNTL